VTSLRLCDEVGAGRLITRPTAPRRIPASRKNARQYRLVHLAKLRVLELPILLAVTARAPCRVEHHRQRWGRNHQSVEAQSIWEFPSIPPPSPDPLVCLGRAEIQLFPRGLPLRTKRTRAPAARQHVPKSSLAKTVRGPLETRRLGNCPRWIPRSAGQVVFRDLPKSLSNNPARSADQMSFGRLSPSFQNHKVLAGLWC
jgi:hypothetical protein